MVSELFTCADVGRAKAMQRAPPASRLRMILLEKLRVIILFSLFWVFLLAVIERCLSLSRLARNLNRRNNEAFRRAPDVIEHLFRISRFSL
jgi:hypothetical protein